MYHRNGPTFLELTRQALSSIERGYDLLAPQFDTTPFRTPDALLQTVFSHVDPANSAIDLCCGTGAVLSHLRPLCTERVVGVDLSQGMLDVARERVSHAEGSATIELIKHDVLDLPESLHGQFDLATSFGAFGHIVGDDEERLVRAIKKLLRPGGRFVFVTAEMPETFSREYVISRAFNGVMRVRNAFWKPTFVMYYLTFLLPRARALLEAQGFTVHVEGGLFATPYRRYVLVTATA